MEEQPEAKKWISGHQEGRFADHVFTKKAALDFVDNLYRLGAKSVRVSNISTEEDWKLLEGSFFEPHMYEGEVIKIYADVIIVDLPDDKDRREAIFSLINNFREDAADYYKESGQKSISIYWDY